MYNMAMHSSKGWLTAYPLQMYSSLHELSLMHLLGLNISWPRKRFFVQFSFSLHTPLQIDPQSYLVFHTTDASNPMCKESCCFSITDFKRWRLDISPYATFDNYLASLNRWHRSVYKKTKEKFQEYGTKAACIEEDWIKDVEIVYKLYCNVAKKHGDRLYDLNFFREIAQRDDYKLLCCRYEGEIVAMCILQCEPPTLHSICCGFDYNHSSKCYAYSWLNFEIIRLGIESKEYSQIDVGLTADNAKKAIGFNSVPSRMDIYSQGYMTRKLLKVLSKVITAKISPEGKLKIGLPKKDHNDTYSYPRTS